jgi:hypothetical protein
MALSIATQLDALEQSYSPRGGRETRAAHYG